MQILIIDDHTLFRQALVPLLKDLDRDVLVIEASTELEAEAAIGCYQALDLIILDLGLPGKGGIDLLYSLREKVPAIPIVILSGESNPKVVRETIDAGARGFIPKTVGVQGLKNAMHLVLDGETYFPLSLLSDEGTNAKAYPPDIDGNSLLTPRQMHVLELLAKGLPNKSIARQLDVSEGTVKLHVSAILRVFGIQNRTEAVLAANRRGLLKDTDTPV